MRGGRIPRKKRNPSAKAADVPPIESKVVESADEIYGADGQESQLTTIQILFGNANIDGSISDSAENLELLKKLWIEIEKSSEFNIEEIKTVRTLMNIFKIYILNQITKKILLRKLRPVFYINFSR